MALLLLLRLLRDNLNLLNVNPSFSKFEINFLTFTLKNLSSRFEGSLT